MKTVDVISKGTILIVDDTPDNLMVLLDFLSDCGFIVLVAIDGKQAIETAEYAHPDLILLDITMPDIDGFEVCQHLKASSLTQDIPVIFMTALTETGFKVKGFSIGAEDYITKPFQQEEVLARVKTHLRLRWLKQQLEEQNQRLQEEIGIREQAEADLKKSAVLLAAQTTELQKRAIELENHNAELDAFAHTVAHDLKNPLSGVIGLADLLIYGMKEGSVDNTELFERLDSIKQVGYQMSNIIDSILLLAGVTRLTEIPIYSLNMTNIVRDALKRIDHLIKLSGGVISLPDSWPKALGYAPWVVEIWTNYLSNALKYGGHPPQLTVGGQVLENNQVKFWVRDNGNGLSQEAQSRLFTPFTRLHQARIEGHGLGLSIVKQIIEKLNGEVGVQSTPGQGSEFFFILPEY